MQTQEISVPRHDVYVPRIEKILTSEKTLYGYFNEEERAELEVLTQNGMEFNDAVWKVAAAWL